MPQTAENYRSLSHTDYFHRQAIKVWSIGLSVVAVWVLLILTAPVAKANGFLSISVPLYRFFSFLCHQIPARSFFIEGEPFGVCSRCFGVYFGLFFGFAIYPLWRRIDNVEPLPRVWLFLSIIPIAVDWSLTVFGIWENTFVTRFLTGLILGVACATYIIPALVEIKRNFSAKRGAV